MIKQRFNLGTGIANQYPFQRIPVLTQSKPIKQEFTLEAVLKKLEKIGIKVNLEELMKD